MELAVDSFSFLVDQLERMGAIAVHVTKAIGDAPITKEEGDLVGGLRPEGDEVPEHVWILGGGGREGGRKGGREGGREGGKDGEREGERKRRGGDGREKMKRRK